MCKHPEEPAGEAHEAVDAAEAAPYDAASLWSRLTYRYALPLTGLLQRAVVQGDRG